MKYINERVKDNVLIGVISGALLLCVFFLFYNFSYFKSEFFRFIDVLMPFIVGFAMAFVLSPLVSLTERIMPKSIKATTKRKCGVVVAFACAIAVISAFMIVVIPQLAESISHLLITLNNFINNIDTIIIELTQQFGIQDAYLQEIFLMLEEWLKSFLTYLTTLIPTIIGSSFSIISSLFSLFVGIAIAVYILFDKEHFYRQAKKMMYAIFPRKNVEWVIEVSNLSSSLFRRFILGKALDSLIIGILCFVCMTIFKMPYALLISTIIGVTNMIPVFGPFIGAVPGVLILVILNPVTALWFILLVIVIQQFDGNILGPYILGDSMGLPSLWVMFAIIVGGGFFGILGMFLGVPLFALIYYLIKTVVNQKLVDKDIQV